MPRFTPCSSSPAPGASSSTNTSTMPATATSDWPTPTVSTSTTSKPAASHTSIASRVRRATPPSVPPDGDGRMNASRPARQLLHARLVAEDRTAARARSTGRPRAPPPRCPASTRCRPSASMNVDFPAPGAPLMPTRVAAPVAGRSSSSSADRVVAMIGARRLDERDRARERAPVAGAHRVGERSSRSSRSSRGRRCAGAPTPGSPTRRGGMLLPGPKIARDARVVQEVVVGARGSRRPRPRRSRSRPARAAPRSAAGTSVLCPAAWLEMPDDVHVVLDRVARRFLGRLEQRADVDVEAEVGERGRDHLGAAVVAVLAELGHEDARPAAFLGRERLDLLADALRTLRRRRTRRRTRRRSYGSSARCGRTPSPARRRSRRPSPAPASPRSRAASRLPSPVGALGQRVERGLHPLRIARRP